MAGEPYLQNGAVEGAVQEKVKKGRYWEMEKELLEECTKEHMVFAFFRKLSPQLLSPYQLDDKTYVECHAHPDAKVILFYALDTGLDWSRSTGASR